MEKSSWDWYLDPCPACACNMLLCPRYPMPFENTKQHFWVSNIHYFTISCAANLQSQGWLCFVSESSNSTQSMGVNSSSETLARFLCCSKHCQCTVQRHMYLCSHMPTHTKRCVYINLWVHTHRNKRSFIMFSFKNNFRQWHCKICLAYNQESAPA